MPTNPCILAFAGSTRTNSWNQKLVDIASEGARLSGAMVTQINLSDYSMPIYDGDLEASQGIPDHAKELKLLMSEHSGLLLASPEYNSGYSPLIKNVIDWISRPLSGETRLKAFSNKTAVLMSASPGSLGGLRGLTQLKQVLENIGVLVLPLHVTLSNTSSAFTQTGELSDRGKHQEIMSLGDSLTKVIRKLQTENEDS